MTKAAEYRVDEDVTTEVGDVRDLQGGLKGSVIPKAIVTLVCLPTCRTPFYER